MPRDETEWRKYLTPEEAAFIKDSDRELKALKAKIRLLSWKRYPVQNRATQRRRYQESLA